ncbi:MAG: YqjK family protein [Gallionella sp.]
MQTVMRRREALLMKISGQREQLSELSTRWNAPLHFSDQALKVLDFMRVHPLLLAGLGGLFVVRRRGLTGMLKGGWRVWKAYRFFQIYLKNRMPSR